MPRKKQCSRCILALVTLVFSLNLAVNVQAQTVTTLASFNGPNGSGPFASVAQATDGNFYGTTTEGGPYGSAGYGVLYRITPAGNLTVIYNFCSQPNCADGWDPTSVPILGQDGNLYGVTAQGGSTAAGSAGSGTIYKMTLGGKITTLYSFCATLPCTDGQSPTGLVQASDGTFYGTTSVVPNSNGGFGGTVFSLSPRAISSCCIPSARWRIVRTATFRSIHRSLITTVIFMVRHSRAETREAVSCGKSLLRVPIRCYVTSATSLGPAAAKVPM